MEDRSPGREPNPLSPPHQKFDEQLVGADHHLIDGQLSSLNELSTSPQMTESYLEELRKQHAQTDDWATYLEGLVKLHAQDPSMLRHCNFEELRGLLIARKISEVEQLTAAEARLMESLRRLKPLGGP